MGKVAGALERCGAAGDYGRGLAGKQAARCAVALQESKLDVPVSFLEGRAVGQQPCSAAGARGSRAAETRARPNVEVNRRTEGTSELNRRLGAVGQGAAALERCGAAGDYGRGLAGKQARCACSVSRRPSSRPATGGSTAGARGSGAAGARARGYVLAASALLRGRALR